MALLFTAGHPYCLPDCSRRLDLTPQKTFKKTQSHVANTKHTTDTAPTATSTPPQHTYFFGCQFHPEYTSSPFKPSPPFRGLIRASAGLPVTITKSAPSPPPAKKQRK